MGLMKLTLSEDKSDQAAFGLVKEMYDGGLDPKVARRSCPSEFVSSSRAGLRSFSETLLIQETETRKNIEFKRQK